MEKKLEMVEILLRLKNSENFELSVDFLVSEGANSGIKHLVKPKTNIEDGSAIGLTQILTIKYTRTPLLGVNGNRALGSLYDLIRAENRVPGESVKDFKGVGKWNNARIVVNNGNVQHWLNHVKIAEFDRFSQSFQALVEKSKYKIWDNLVSWSEGVILPSRSW